MQRIAVVREAAHRLRDGLVALGWQPDDAAAAADQLESGASLSSGASPEPEPSAAHSSIKA
eukprot:COSAG01_NODE_64780_length_275_cov_0.863636_1_plen_60_part_01